MISSWQTTQVDHDALLGLNVIALITFWSYDYILCLPDAVTFLAESRWGLGTFLYLTCSHLPLAFMSLNMLVVFQPDVPLHLCRSYNIANTYVGIMSMLCAECIFIIRAYAVWERGRWFAAMEIFTIVAYVVPISFSLQQFNSEVSEPCWIPGTSGILDAETSTQIFVAFGLLAIAELQTLLLLLYRAIKWRSIRGTNNCLIRGLMKDNLLYCCCGIVFSLSVILTTIFLPFPVGHLVAECQVVVQALLVTRMHRSFWRTDRASCGITTDVSLTTWMIGALEFT
ncbi:hypothetical protein BDR05DRAFT_957629 [Suillus weaverae]|nr:hypothetical protein BDR05DRAFT_957629 [Suillus weaverae]